MRKLTIIIVVYINIFFSLHSQNINIIPKPSKVDVLGGVFLLNEDVRIVANNVGGVDKYLQTQVKMFTGLDLTTDDNATEQMKIKLTLDSNLESSNEGYELSVSVNGCEIIAKTTNGLFYGIQTFLQLLPINPVKECNIPWLRITDSPRFMWRGMMLDVSRHFFSKEFILKFIDLLALHKMNTLHLHLVDDQGWRIEIKKYPKLTEIGAWREDDTDKPWNYFVYPTNDRSKKLYGGFYSQDDIREIVKYARERYVTIVPEIEMPGHCSALLEAYPEFSCSGKVWRKDLTTPWEFSNPLCLGNEKTYAFLEDVLAEVMDLFPSEYIHIGGDECKKTTWQQCAKCQNLMKAKKLTKEEQLQSVLLQRMEKTLALRNRKLIGWDEILEGGITSNAAIMSWRGTEGGIATAKHENYAVMSPTTHCYFNFPEAKNLIKANYQSVISLEKVFGFEPVPTELSSDKAKYILGGQANVWTELLITPEQIEEKILPRMCALSEVLWTEKEKRTGFSDFLSRLNHVYPRLAAMNYNCFIQPLKSPDGKIVFLLQQNNNRLSYNVTMEDSVVIEDSPLGLERNDISFSEDLLFIGIENSEINDSYDLKTGKQLHNIVNGKQSNFVFKNKKNGEIMILQVRAYNEGIAFRYVFPEKSDKTYSILEEKTGFKIPVAGRTWIMPYDTISTYTPSYETYFTNGAPVGTLSPNKEGWSFPALFQVKNKWVLITESGLNETYCASHLQPDPAGGLYRIRFPEKTEALGLFSENPSNQLPWATPWRVIILGNNCGSIVESSLVTHLAEPSKIENTEWIKPGKSSWSWWSDHDSPRNFESLKNFVDLSAGMGWEYSLVDANWDIMQGGNVRELIDYARKKNVGIWLWYNSGGKINNVTERPRDIMFDPVKRKAEFAKLQSWGVKGVKIDFFQSDKQEVIKLYLDILQAAADAHIMVNFHGCTLPHGWQRTYPNLMTMEAVRGAENYAYDADYPQRAMWHNTIYPFTRNVVGSMDYTPVTLSNQKFPHLTSNAHELALAIVFESGILHFADKIDSYTGLDYSCKQLLKNLPTTWDETRFIAGEPGKYVVLARRKGTDWFVAGINGQNESQKVNLNPVEFKLTEIIGDKIRNAGLESVKIENSTQTIEIVMNKFGGFVVL